MDLEQIENDIDELSKRVFGAKNREEVKALLRGFHFSVFKQAFDHMINLIGRDSDKEDI